MKNLKSKWFVPWVLICTILATTQVLADGDELHMGRLVLHVRIPNGSAGGK